MTVLPKITTYAEELTAVRRDIHAHPEIGFEEQRTSAIVADMLASWDIEVHRGIGKTGVVGVLEGKGSGTRTIGLRADMDALPMDEQTNLPYASQNPGRFHGCGHDAHTTMLLGAARYLSETRDFDGRVVFIFQPAEEGLGGARAMIEDGLFKKFPCDEIYGMHNDPGAEENTFTIKPGVAMAGASLFEITITGVGSHAAHPHQSRDPIVVVTQLVQALQSIVSRNVDPTEAAVLSVTQIHSGSAYNVVPEKAMITGTIRYFSNDARDTMHARVETICAGLAQSFEVDIDAKVWQMFAPLDNDADLSEAYLKAAQDVVGETNVRYESKLVTGSEDFADMLAVVPGAYCRIGHKGSVPLHNPGFVVDDDMLPVGASIMARLIETRLPL
ncbi:hippurate hydrolase [Breoghania corrubedonensis]|uniref:Hippurate hydrolase n=1 Tax=Breoghania corrubedonensis TaxID=665038 RepID=A0A2T5V7Z6_9HYPH|nr:M20 aminoacylase family protein [Breoghania corrubedonensis]PTW59854.1 hippurate hydrolase [Breoghania corrubedonensis]